MIHLLLTIAALLAPPPPFTIDATEDASASFPGAPHIQSFSFAQWQGRWVFIGGRITGYHALGGASADFPRAESNRDVWVIDTTVSPARSYHAPVSSLPASLQDVKDEWQSSGQFYYQDGASLYVGGGYGEDSTGHWLTFPLIAKIDLPKLIEGVIHGQIPPASISAATSPLVQSAGGDLVKLSDGGFYLVMGHVFTGSYTAFEGQGESNSHTVSQTYLNEIRKLDIQSAPLSVKLIKRFRDESQFHRRDLNVVQIISPKGVGLAAYGGVFTPDTQLSYSKPVYLPPSGEPVVDSAFDQKMNAYNTARLLLYDPAEQTMFTVLFGGISQFAWDADNNCYVENARTGGKTQSSYLDGMEWSDQISVIRKGKQQTSEITQPTPLPGFVGTEGVFIPMETLSRASAGTEILDLMALRGKRTLVGYIYGGIRAYPYRFPYNKSSQPYNSGTVPTQPSDLILKVYLQAMN